MKRNKRYLIIILLFFSMFVAIILWIINRQNVNYDNNSNSIMGIVDEKTQQVVLNSDKNKSNDITLAGEIYTSAEDGNLNETVFSYFIGETYDEINMPERFGYVVEESMVSREVPIKEEDFYQIKKGQYLAAADADAFKSPYNGIVEIIGQYDGRIMYTQRASGTGIARMSPYYKINDNEFAILLFKDNLVNLPLEKIEIWNAEGSKLREIEIE